MNIKNFINNLFEQNYNFSIINNNNEKVKPINNNHTSIYLEINKNLEFIKSKYNTLINSDIVIREFETLAQNQLYKSFIIYIDGLVNSISINDFVLEPLMFPKRVQNPNPANLLNYIDNRLLPQNSVNKVEDFEAVCSGINMGNCLLFIDTLNIAFDIDVKKYNSRSVDKPENEVIIKGPQESFIENIRTNTSLLRKIVNNENLVIENIPVGNISKTKCGVCYMKNIANSDLVGEVKFRLYKGNIIKAGTTSPYSLYSESLASFTTGDLYDHHDADGFITLFGLPLKVRAMKMQEVEKNNK